MDVHIYPVFSEKKAKVDAFYSFKPIFQKSVTMLPPPIVTGIPLTLSILPDELNHTKLPKASKTNSK